MASMVTNLLSGRFGNGGESEMSMTLQYLKARLIVPYARLHCID